MKKAIIGAGGFAREVYHHMINDGYKNISFFVDDKYATSDVFPLSMFDPFEYEVVVAVGDPKVKKLIIDNLPADTNFFTFIHSSALILDKSIKIGKGSIICANCILTTNIVLGDHVHLNLATTIGHDVNIGDYFTSAPGVHISGNCDIGTQVYFGTNSSIKQKLSVCDDVTIGMHGGVVKSIKTPGTYIGCPATIIQ